MFGVETFHALGADGAHQQSQLAGRQVIDLQFGFGEVACEQQHFGRIGLHDLDAVAGSTGHRLPCRQQGQRRQSQL
ncbi:hypothetical protein D3C71_1605490 [compost metagenome]